MRDSRFDYDVLHAFCEACLTLEDAAREVNER